MKIVSRMLVDETGVTAIEYALIAALIAVAILSGVSTLGIEIQAMYQGVCTAVVGAISGGSC
ncbi:MAG: Flp family type IVb pilin [Burkholderiales bacterium]|nr:MAG: Flp family type IVb pilin [Burkholderiales bacterium]